MTVTISNGIVILLLFLQNISAQQGVSNVVNNAMSQPKTTCTTAGSFNSVQPGQQINWQQPSNMQPISQQPQNFQQTGTSSQWKQQNVNSLSDIFSALQNVRFSSQKPQGGNSMPSGYNQAAAQPQSQPAQASSNPQTANAVPDYQKPTFTFQFVPVSSQNAAQENQMQNFVPVQFLANGQSQISSQAGPSYYTQNQRTNGMTSQQIPTQTSSGQSQPIVYNVNSQQPVVQSQPIVYTLQPTQQSRSGNQQKTSQTVQPNLASDNPMALMMSQLQSSSGNPDMASLLPMLMGSKQEKSGIKALLPLILNLLSDKGCGCPHCGCPCNNAEPTITGGYSNQINYSKQDLSDVTTIPESSKSEAKKINGSSKVDRESKKYKPNVINDSEEASDEDDEYEYDDDED